MQRNHAIFAKNCLCVQVPQIRMYWRTPLRNLLKTSKWKLWTSWQTEEQWHVLVALSCVSSKHKFDSDHFHSQIVSQYSLNRASGYFTYLRQLFSGPVVCEHKYSNFLNISVYLGSWCDVQNKFCHQSTFHNWENHFYLSFSDIVICIRCFQQIKTALLLRKK